MEAAHQPPRNPRRFRSQDLCYRTLCYRTLGLLVAATLWLLTPSCLPAQDADAVTGAWRLSDVWDDGKAEYAAYEVDWRRYGQLFKGRALLVVVKEPWAPDLDVKADQPRPDGFDVVKLNHIRDVDTGIYTYHQMASIFQRRDDGDLQKLSAMSSEACGLSTALLTDGQLQTSSYFDGQGTRTQPYPQSALPTDGLPMLLRDYLGGPLPERLQIFPSLLQGRFPMLEPVDVVLQRRAVSGVEVPAGTFHGIEVIMTPVAGDTSGDQRGAGSTEPTVWVFDARPPHVLLRLRQADGTEYRLAKVERLPYWGMAQPGQEAWWPENLR